MKNVIYTIAAVILSITISCKKSTDGNKNVLVADNSNVKETTKRFVAEDGTSALVTVFEGDKENSISVRSNNKTISAEQKTKTAEGGIYENYDFQIVAKNDTVTITQGNNVIILRKAKGE